MEDKIFQQSIFSACSLYRYGPCHQPLFSTSLPPYSCPHYISSLFSGLRKHFNTWKNGYWIEKNIVERAQKAAVSATSAAQRHWCRDVFFPPITWDTPGAVWHIQHADPLPQSPDSFKGYFHRDSQWP